MEISIAICTCMHDAWDRDGQGALARWDLRPGGTLRTDLDSETGEHTDV